LKKVSTEEKTKPSITDLEIELEKTIDLAPIKEEIQKNEDFLKMLKEFRKNLE